MRFFGHINDEAKWLMVKVVFNHPFVILKAPRDIWLIWNSKNPDDINPVWRQVYNLMFFGSNVFQASLAAFVAETVVRYRAVVTMGQAKAST